MLTINALLTQLTLQVYTPCVWFTAKTVSVSACDIDGDGREEVYLHNVNGVYSNAASYVTPDRLIRKTGSRYKDVFDDPSNRDLAPRTAGTSVSCVDVRGDGKYAFFVTTVTDGSYNFNP